MSTPQNQTAPKNNDKKAAPPVDAKAAASVAAPKADASKSDAPKADAPKTDTPPEVAASAASNGTDGSATGASPDAEPKERQKVYIVVGEVHEFKNASEAEKFLNKDAAAPLGDFTVIKGKKVEKKAKVSLR
jgi:hypothetical protein